MTSPGGATEKGTDTPAGKGEAATASRLEPGSGSFYRRLPGSLAYPFKGRGWILIIGGAGTFWVASLLAFVSFLGMLLGFILGAYLCAYMIKIIGRSAAGEEEPPDWPDITDLDDLVQPLLLVIGTALLCFLPVIILLVGPWLDLMAPHPTLLRAFVVVGLLYLPMALVAVALFDSLWALNPWVILVAIAKVAPAYAAALLMLAASIAATTLVGQYTGRIPLFGGLVTNMVFLYCLMVVMRVLGLIYNAYARRLGWFE